MYPMTENNGFFLTARARFGPIRIFTLLFMVMAVLLAGCAKTKIRPMTLSFVPCPGQLLAQNGTRISWHELPSVARDYDYVLVGEHHKNRCDHLVQARLVRALQSAWGKFSIGLEMVGVDKNKILDQFNVGSIPVDELEQELDWRESWGYPFSLFKDIFTFAAGNDIPVHGLNTPAKVARKAGKDMDSLTPAEKKLLPEKIVPPPAEQAEMLTEVLSFHHNGEKPDQARIDRFFTVQSIWDSRMAQEAVYLRKKYQAPVLAVAGAGHVEYGFGIAHRIRIFDPKAKILSIAPLRGGDLNADAGDMFFYCPLEHVSGMGMVLEERFGRVMVTEVNPGSRADAAGLRPGDILVSSQGVEMKSLMDLHLAGTKAHRQKADLVLEVLRGMDEININLGELGKR